MIPEVLLRAIRKDNEIKGIQIGKENVKLSLFANKRILYNKTPEKSTKNLLELTKTFSTVAKVLDQYIQIKNQLYMYALETPK